MPTHIRSRFTPADLAGWEPAEPFAFTKGLRTMRIPADGEYSLFSPWRFGTLLFDLETDPGQEHPLDDPALELRMAQLLVDGMRATDAPHSQFARLGLPVAGDVGPEHLLVAAQAERANAVVEPLVGVADLPELVRRPIAALLGDAATEELVRRHLPSLLDGELVSAPRRLSVLGLAEVGLISAGALRRFAEAVGAGPGHADEGGH